MIDFVDNVFRKETRLTNPKHTKTPGSEKTEQHQMKYLKKV